MSFLSNIVFPQEMYVFRENVYTFLKSIKKRSSVIVSVFFSLKLFFNIQ